MEAKALKSKKINSGALFVVRNLFMRHGVVRELLSDQGKEFTGGLIKEICKLMGTKKTFTSAYNPEANGSVERANRTLVHKLSKLCNGAFKEWDDFLGLAVWDKGHLSDYGLINGLGNLL